MEPLITTQPTETATPTSAPAAMRPMHSHKKRWILISIAVVVIALAAGAWIMFRAHKKDNPTPEESLQQLQQSSHDVYVPIEDRAAKLKTLSGDKTVPKSSTQAQLDILNTLKN